MNYYYYFYTKFFIIFNLFFIIVSSSSNQYRRSVPEPPAPPTTAATTTTQTPIFINQSDNINIIAKLGHTIHLPCVIYKTNEQSNMHVIWSKLNEKSRAKVLTIGLQQLTFDMRYRVRIKTTAAATAVVSDDEQLSDKTTIVENSSADDADESSRMMMMMNELSANKALVVENWQLEIRKVAYEDTGLYQCSLSLVVPQYKNITIKIIPDLTIHPKKAIYAPGQHIHLKCHTNLTLQHKRQLKSGLLSPSDSTKLNELIKWYKDSKHLTSVEDKRDDDKSSVLVNTRLVNDNMLYSELIVNNIDYEDTAVYRCVYEGVQEKSVISVHNSAYKSYFLTSKSNSRIACELKLFTTIIILLLLINI